MGKTFMNPDFFLSSSESTYFQERRACYLEGVVADDIRDDYLLVRIEPPVRDPETQQLVDRLLLCGRYSHFTTVSKEECVYILKLLSPEVIKSRRCNKGQVKLVAIGEVHPVS